MTILKSDEMAILKAVSMKITDDVMLIATLQYHTEKNDSGKNDREKSRYRWLARVVNVNDLRETIKTMMADENRIQSWKWPNDPSWDGKMFTSNDCTNRVGAKWFSLRISKCVDWDLGQKLLNGWKTTKNEYNLNAKYEIADYTADDGSTVSLDNKDVLLTKVGQNLVKEQILKTKIAI